MENNNDNTENGGNSEYTRSNENQELHNMDQKNQDVEDTQRDTSMEITDEEYSNTSTGYNVSASARKENFTDENYGATGSRTLKNIKRDLEANEIEE